MANNSSRIVIPVALVILFAAGSLAGAEIADFGLVRQIAVYADGHQEVRYDVYDVGAGREWVPRAGTEWERRAKSQSALVTNTFHWDRGVEIRLWSTEMAAGSSQRIRRILSLLNEMRGTAGVPTFTLVDELVEVRPPGDFSDLLAYATQLDMDNVSTVVMTEDDLLIETRMGRPDPLFMVTIFLSGQVHEDEASARFVGELRIREADIYLTSLFFESPRSFYERYAAHAFRMALGYQYTCWASDLLGITNLNEIDLDVWNEASPMVRLLQERDRFYYADVLPRTATFHEEPRMMPAADSAIDLAPYGDLPSGNPALARPVIGLTNLLAFGGAKKLQVGIHRVAEGPPQMERRLVTLKGNLIDWPSFHPVIGYWYPTVFLNEIRLGREKHVKKLRKAVRRFGTATVVDGREWQKALRVKVKITGWWSEDGPKRTLTRYLYLTDSDREP